MRKSILFSLVAAFGISTLSAQESILPKGLTPHEEAMLPYYQFPNSERGISTPPEGSNIRTMAEWEEIQALVIAWQSYPGILKQIVAAAKNECEVIILSENPSQTQAYLTGGQSGGALDLENVTILDVNTNSVWMRDYAANSVYTDGVDGLVYVDWVYNRPRPEDDASPAAVADYLGLDLYCTTEAPNDLVNTGGNFMSDGFGTGFASDLILEENEPGNPYDVTPKNEDEINGVMADFMGLDRYIKMEALPYDIIHHIDMHMKLIDEETLLVGYYPEGVADGPQINANIDYVLSNFNSMFGTPYNVVRIEMPSSASGLYPDDAPVSGYYRTFTNSVFVNKTIIFPTYRDEVDEAAYAMYADLLPGYNVVGIDCDDNPEQIIAASGAIHCITHSVGVEDPLLISHQPLPDTMDDINPYEAIATLEHKDGIESAKLYYRIYPETSSYIELEMEPTGDINSWSALIPAQPEGTRIEYYIRGEASTGKVQVRPMVAPEGYWNFNVGEVLIDNVEEDVALDEIFGAVYPNPANAMTAVPMDLKTPAKGWLKVYDVLGKEVLTLHQGEFPMGEQKYFFNAQELSKGTYQVTLRLENGIAKTQRVVVY